MATVGSVLREPLEVREAPALAVAGVALAAAPRWIGSMVFVSSLMAWVAEAEEVAEVAVVVTAVPAPAVAVLRLP